MVKKVECVTDSRRADNQTVALEKAAATYASMMQGKTRFRMLLVAKDGSAQAGSRQRFGALRKSPTK